MKKQTTTIMALLLTLGTSCGALALEAKGPPDAGIKVLKVTSNSSVVYANDMMQAEVLVHYEIDPTYQVKTVGLYELYTRESLESKGYTVSKTRNTIDGRDIPTVIGRSAEEIQHAPVDKNASFERFFVSGKSVSKIKICTELVLTNGSKKDTCEGTTNDAFVSVDYVAPMTYAESEFKLVEANDHIHSAVNPAFRMYNLVRNDGRVDFYYDDRDNKGDGKLVYRNNFHVSYPLGYRNTFVTARAKGQGSSWSNSVFLFKPDAPKFVTLKTNGNSIQDGFGEWVFDNSIPKILNVVGVNLSWEWEFGTDNFYNEFLCQERRGNISFLCYTQQPGTKYHSVEIKKEVFEAEQPSVEKRTMMLRDGYGNKVALRWAVGGWGDAYFNDQYIRFQ